MIKAVIFDMDGVIVDSELIQSEAYETVLKKYGKEPILNEVGIVHTVGIKEKENWEILKKKYELEKNTELLMSERSVVYLDLLKQNTKPMKGVLELIKLLKEKNITMAVASSSVMEHIKTVLSTLEIESHFEVVVSGQFVERGKPFPDINLEAARQMRVEPEECLVLEDAQSGVEAAKNGGMKVVAVPNEFTKSHDLSKADYIITDLNEFNQEWLR